MIFEYGRNENNPPNSPPKEEKNDEINQTTPVGDPKK